MTAVIGSSLMETSPSYALGALYVGLMTTHVMGMATFVPPGSMLTMATMMMGPTVSKLANVGYFIYWYALEDGSFEHLKLQAHWAWRHKPFSVPS